MASAKHAKKRRKRKAKKAKTIDLTLRLNVELAQGKQQPRKERVKYIRSRKRQNLREMRRSLPGAGGPQAFANPAFFGNVKSLTDSAMNQFQTKRYNLEHELRDARAEQQALLRAGKEEAASQLQLEADRYQRQLATLQQQFLGQAQQAGAAAGYAKAKADVAEGQLEQQAVEQQYQVDEAAAEAAALSQTRQQGESWLKEQAAALLAQRFGEGFTPTGIKPQKFKDTKDLMVRAVTFQRDEDIEELQDAFDSTARAKQLKKAGGAGGAGATSTPQFQAARGQLRKLVPEEQSPLPRTASWLQRQRQAGGSPYRTPPASPEALEPKPKPEPEPEP